MSAHNFVGGIEGKTMKHFSKENAKQAGMTSLLLLSVLTPVLMALFYLGQTQPAIDSTVRFFVLGH
jgi:hypothetical protein